MRFDTHTHSHEGSIDSHVSIEENIASLYTKGYQGMLITDHDSYSGYRSYLRNIKNRKYHNFIVLRGIEYDTMDGGHILVIMPPGFYLPLLELRGLKLAHLIGIVHHFGGILGPAHPYGDKFMSFMNSKMGHNYPMIASQFDFIETFNACIDAASNEKARQLALRFNKPGFGGSDSHHGDCIGLGYVDIDGDIHDENDLIFYVKNRKNCFATGGELYPHTNKQRIGRLNTVLVYAFYFYNKFGAFLKRKKRRAAVIDTIEDPPELR